MKKRYRILSLLMAATIAFTSLDVSAYAADLQLYDNEESTQANLGASSNQGNDNGDTTNTDNTDPVPTLVVEPTPVVEPTQVVEPSPTPEVPEGGNTDDPADPADPSDPSGNENESGDPENTEGEEGLDEELLDEELLDEELEEEEEDEDELIVTFERFRPVNTDYKLALDSLKELFPTKIVAYTDKDNEVEFEITDWEDVDNYDKLLGKYYFKPVFESDYELDEGVKIPNLAVKVKDESEGAKGYVEFGDDVLKASTDNNSVAYENLKLPSGNSDSYYNAYESGMIPEIRDQGQEGACWAFATMAAVEANLIKNGMASRDDIDLSELQLAYFTTHGYDDPKDCRDSDTYTIGNTSKGYLDNGGNSTIASQALLNKVGVVEEVYAPYSKGSSYTLDDSYAVSRDYAEVTQAIKVDISDVKAVQNAIKTYGAAVASFYATQYDVDATETTTDSNGNVIGQKPVKVRYSATHNSYYSSGAFSSNHAVTIVGWDDNFPKENFHEECQPESDGAWLIRNSWGLDGYGFRGYFWMSYCDRSLLKGETVTVYSATTDMYDNVYSYASGVNGGYYSPNTTGSSMTAEVEYSVKAGESVEAVTVEVDNTNSSVTVEVTDGKTTSTGTLHNESKGIYTIKLDNPIQVTSDSDIKVKYTIQASADEKPRISYEGSLSNYGDIKLSHNVSCDKGFMLNGYQRVDSDARVKLLTNDTGVVEKGTLELATTRVFDYAGTTHQIEIAEGSVTTNPSDITWSVVDENKATVDANGVITVGNEHGKTVVIGRYTDSQGYDYQVSVLVVVKAYTISYELGDDVYKISLPTSYYPGDSSACRLAETQYSSYYPVAKNGYKFAGWYLDSDFQTQVTSASLLNMTGNITLYPKWDLAAVSIRFYEPLSDGSGYRNYSRYITAVKINQTPFNIPAKGTYDPNTYAPNGKKFDYWSLDPEGNEPIESITADNASFVPKKYSYGYDLSADDILLYPQYKDLENSEVTFNANGGTVTISSKSYPFNKAFGNLPVPTRKGYTFAGWYSSVSSGTRYDEDTVATAPSYTMYAHWTAASYFVTYDANGGTVGTAGKTVTYNSTYGTLPTPKRDGYTFKGWGLNSADGDIINNLSRVTVDADHKLVAIWEARSFYVYYRANGGIISTDSKQVTYGDSYGQLSIPTKTGYDFTGWHLGSVDGELITSDSKVATAGSIYLYASWEPKTFTVTFNANNGTVSKESKTVSYGGTFGKMPVPTREGYKFKGWFASTNGNATEYTESSKYNYNYDITVFAQWTPLSYVVSYDANGGTIALNTKNVTFDGTYGYLSNPSRVGYTFKNWHLDSIDGEVVTSDTTVATAENHKLVAEWEANSYRVVFNANGGNTNPDTKMVIFDSTYGELPEAEKSGYVFAGWFTSVNAGDKITEDTKVSITSNQMVYAHWIAEDTKTIFYNGLGTAGAGVQYKTVVIGRAYGELLQDVVPGYEFIGWYSETLKRIVTSSDIVQNSRNTEYLTAKFRAIVNTINVTLDYADGREQTVQQYSWTGGVNGDEIIRLSSAEGELPIPQYSELPIPTRDGYNFVAWHVGNVDSTIVKNGDEISLVNGDITLVAEWKEKDPVAAPIITIQDTSNPDLKRLAGVDEDTVGTNSVMNINTETDGAEIYYTKNATVADAGYTDTNSASWTKYDADAGITITEDNAGTFYAVATKAGLKSSTVVSRSISVRDLDNDASLIANEEDRAEYLENKKNGIWVGGLGTTRVYNGAAYKLVPDVDFRVYDGVVLLQNKTDYTYALKNNVNAGNATLAITGRGNYKDTLQFTFVIDKKDFSEATFTLAKDCYQYTGKVIKAGVTVKDVRNGKTLTLGNNREYTLTYYDFDEETNSYVAANTKKTESGKKAVVITGKGNYVGSETLYYRVADKNQTLNGASIKVNTNGIELGKDTQLTNDRLTVTVNRKVLTQEQLAACTITYKYLDTPANSDYSHGDDTYGDYIYSPGKYSITIVGDAGENEDSLFGTATATFSVGGGKAITTRMNKATFVSKVDYTGNVIQQNYEFYDGTDPLVEDIDYLVVRADGTNVGSYKDFVYGIGKYKGKLTYSYSIVGKPISTRTTKVDITSEAGDKIFEFKNDAYDLDEMNVVVTIDGVEVDADNYTVTLPKDMTNVGTKDITIVGKNAYTGKFVARKALTISQVDVATSDKVEFVYDSDVDYVKGGVKQVPSVVFNGETLDAKTVSANFAFSYTNNTGRVAKNDSDVVKITVKPKKNFKASTALTPLEYTINKSDINETAITVNDMVYNASANKVKSGVVLKDTTNNKALQNNTDYEKTIRYQYAEINSPITQKIKKEIVTVDRVVGDDIQSADIIPVGTKIKVTVSGKGNYYGTQTAVYRIISSQLSKVGVSVKKDSKLAAGYDYNGKERFISKSDLVVKNGKNELTSEDYDIVSYVNNVKKGKATITLRGKGNFGGTKTYTYNINAKSVSYSVTFDAVSPATGTMKKAVVNNSTYKLPKSTHKINTKQYVFDGWYYDEELTERAGAAGETIVLSEKIEPSETLNLYAKWKTK